MPHKYNFIPRQVPRRLQIKLLTQAVDRYRLGHWLLGPSPSAPGAPPFFGGTAHDFDPGPGVDVVQRITVPQGARFIISFQWDSPFASVCPGCPGSPNDLDIYVFNDPPTTVLAGSASIDTGGDAVEVFGFINPPGSGATAFNVLITAFDGPTPQLIKYVRMGGGNVTITEFDTRSSTLYGHVNAAGAAAVGAAFYGDTPAFGVSPPLLQPFSRPGRPRSSSIRPATVWRSRRFARSPRS